jgi:ferritin
MLSEKMEKALNDQVNAELFSAYLYLSMAAYFESIGLSGFGKWMEIQTMEEMTHAKKIYDYINERGGRVVLEAIEKPKIKWSTPLEAFKDAYKHEQYISGLINNLVDISIEEKDHATNNFLQWFVAEQVEEEASAEEIVQKLKLVGDRGNAIFMMDRELGQRTFTPPSTNE